jgi:hypothetical protein
MFSWQDLQSFADDLSAWIIELDLVDELQKAHPRGIFPLKADPELDDAAEDLDVLIFLTLWMCLKAKTKAPPHLESRIIFSPNTVGPWKQLYVRLCARIEQKEEVLDIWNLAS